MPNGVAIRNRITKALAKLGGSSKTVKFRTVTVTGGNARLGIGGTETVTDTVIDPRPVVERVTAEEIATSGGLYMPGDYRLTMHGSITEDALRNNLLLYGDEQLQIKSYEPSVIGSTVVAWTVIARSVKAGN